MAIGPSILTKNLMEEVDRYEKELDIILSGKKVTSGSAVSVVPPSGMSYSHFQHLKERYLKAGWADITWHDDQRDGTYIVFSTK